MIVVKNSGLFKKETAKRKTSDLKEIRDSLEKYLKENAEEIKERLVLVFVEDKIEKLNITKTVQELSGIVCEFSFQNLISIEKRLTSICSAYKVKVDNGAIKFLVETSGTSMQNLINEIRKLIEYVRRRGNNY